MASTLEEECRKARGREWKAKTDVRTALTASRSALRLTAQSARDGGLRSS